MASSGALKAEPPKVLTLVILSELEAHPESSGIERTVFFVYGRLMFT
jgi:hypothetical protein